MFDVLTELYQGSSFIVPHDLSDFVSGVHSFQPPLIVVYCRVDRINEAEFKSASNTKTSPTHPPHHPGQQTSFLWTIGPRPFWELWPNKKHKKKKLNLEEFIQCLLEQWAKTHNYPIELASVICLEKDQGLLSTPVSKALFNYHKSVVKMRIASYPRYLYQRSMLSPC